MTNYYTLKVYDHEGKLVGFIDRFNRLEYVLNEREPGSLTLTYSGTDPSQMPFNKWHDGNQIEVWRSIDGGTPYLEGSAGDGAVWNVTTFGQQVNSSGQHLITISAPDSKELLKRRIINYRSGSVRAETSGEYGNIMYAHVRGAFDTQASDGTTEGPVDLRTVLQMEYLYPTLSGLLTGTKKAAWMNLFDTLSDLCDAYKIDPAGGTNSGNWIGFDVIRGSAVPNVAFKIFYDQRGTYRGLSSGTNILVFDQALGHLNQPNLVFDYTDYINYVRIGGEGEGVGQTISALQMPLDELKRGGPFGRRETYITASGATVGDLVSEGYNYVVSHRPLLKLEAKLASPPDRRYGLHWRHGDVVVAKAFGYSLDCRVAQVHVTISADNAEQIDATVLSTRLVDT